MRLVTGLFLAILSQPLLAIDLVGITEFEQRLEINSSISARVAEVHVVLGQSVNAGDTLVSLVSTGLQAHVDIARARVDGMIPEVERMLTELEKARELYDRESLARVPLRQAEQNHAMALARLAAAEANLELAEFQLGQAQIRSPIDGIVLGISTFTGQYINTRVEDQSLLTIAGTRNMSVNALLPVENYNAELLGRPARVTYLRQGFDGRVVAVDRQISTGANNHPALSVRIRFVTDGSLPAGLPVQVEIE
jgi:multidrug efflux pump subunit AcrA (membrane-fusion protein)